MALNLPENLGVFFTDNVLISFNAFKLKVNKILLVLRDVCVILDVKFELN